MGITTEICEQGDFVKVIRKVKASNDHTTKDRGASSRQIRREVKGKGSLRLWLGGCARPYAGKTYGQTFSFLQTSKMFAKRQTSNHSICPQWASGVGSQTSSLRKPSSASQGSWQNTGRGVLLTTLFTTTTARPAPDLYAITGTRQSICLPITAMGRMDLMVGSGLSSV